MRHCVWLALVVLVALALLAWAVRSGRFGNSDAVTAPTDDSLTGRVIDSHGPVAGARVRIKGRRDMVLSDASGRFRLPRSEGEDLSVTAAKPGYLIAGISAHTRPLVLRLTPLPAKDHAGYHWVDPTPDASGEHNCGNCHDEIYEEWKSSGHARSITGRHFRNLYAGTDWHGKPGRGWSLLDEYPDGAGVCTSCHGPTVGLSDAAFYDLRQTKGVAAQGVHCDYCHKIEDVSTEKFGLTHGRFALKLLRPAEGQLFFGPLDDVDRGEDAFSPLQSDSRICASCHEGTVFGVPVYTTYTEWLASPARAEGKQCQSCHMTPTGKMRNIAPSAGGILRDPATLASHSFLPGGREAMLRRCLDVDVTMERDGTSLQTTVRIIARNVGHRVPTGFIDRHLLLVVQGLGRQGQWLPLKSGPVLPWPAGGFAGQPGRLFAKLLLDNDGRGPIPFWRAAAEPIDTRLVPRQAVGSTFEFPPDTRQVRVRLLSRRFWETTVRSKDWPDGTIAVYDRTLPGIEALENP